MLNLSMAEADRTAAAGEPVAWRWMGFDVNPTG